MLDDFDKGFRLFAMQISPKMAKISLSFESHGIGCNTRITYTLYLQIASTYQMTVYKHRVQEVTRHIRHIPLTTTESACI
jgi:hypothetical protein